MAFDIRGEVNVRTETVDVEAGYLQRSPGQDGRGPRMLSLVIGGQQVPTEAFEKIPEEQIAGEPLGHVNWWWGDNAHLAHSEHRQIVWVNGDGEARRTIVSPEPPVGKDPIAWRQRYEELAALPQLFIGE